MDDVFVGTVPPHRRHDVALCSIQSENALQIVRRVPREVLAPFIVGRAEEAQLFVVEDGECAEVQLSFSFSLLTTSSRLYEIPTGASLRE